MSKSIVFQPKKTLNKGERYCTEKEAIMNDEVTIYGLHALNPNNKELLLEVLSKKDTQILHRIRELKHQIATMKKVGANDDDKYVNDARNEILSLLNKYDTLLHDPEAIKRQYDVPVRKGKSNAVYIH